MDLRTWIADEHASVLTRYEQGVVDLVPVELWKDAVGRGGSSIAYLAFHTTYHADLAVNAVLREQPTVLSTARTELGLAAISAADGLGEAEVPELTAALDVAALQQYVREVHAANQAWLDTLDGSLFERADAGGSAGLAGADVPHAEVPWLYAMWDAKPAAFFVQWEAIGHRLNHVGEMVSVRNRLGLSPH